MRTFALFRCIILFLIIFISTISAQQSPPTTPAGPATPTNATTRTKGHHGGKGGHHRGGRNGHHRRNAARVFGYHRSADPNWATNHTLIAKEFLHAHNWVRTQYRLPNYTWDENLASFARGYLANQRYVDCQLTHSQSNYGENLFWGKRLHWTPSDAVYYWYIEKDAWNFQTLKCAPPPAMCGHFTQMVWRDSTRVGCALQHCRDQGSGMLLACEYDPQGNYPNENPLEVHPQ